jgi:hypothetical protein
MTQTPASAEDFARWAKRAKQATDCTLDYVIKDCREAALAMAGHDPIACQRYNDELFTYADEQMRRREENG